MIVYFCLLVIPVRISSFCGSRFVNLTFNFIWNLQASMFASIRSFIRQIAFAFEASNIETFLSLFQQVQIDVCAHFDPIGFGFLCLVCFCFKPISYLMLLCFPRLLRCFPEAHGFVRSHSAVQMPSLVAVLSDKSQFVWCMIVTRYLLSSMNHIECTLFFHITLFIMILISSSFHDLWMNGLIARALRFDSKTLWGFSTHARFYSFSLDYVHCQVDFFPHMFWLKQAGVCDFFVCTNEVMKPRSVTSILLKSGSLGCGFIIQIMITAH